MRLLRRMGKWFVALVLVVAAVIGVAAFSGYMNTYTWNQKLTVEVETPQGLRNGESVTRVSKGVSSFVPGHPGGLARSRLRGEAVVVEVVPDSHLFALLGDLDHLAQKLFAAEIGLDRHPSRMPEFEEWAQKLSRLRASRQVPPDLYPLLVTFTDVDDPKTVTRVDPGNLAAAFGPGYRLKSITLEITHEPVTSGRVEEVLGWWKMSRDEFLKLGGGTNPLKMPDESPRGYESISRTSFKMGE